MTEPDPDEPDPFLAGLDLLIQTAWIVLLAMAAVAIVLSAFWD